MKDLICFRCYVLIALLCGLSVHAFAQRQSGPDVMNSWAETKAASAGKIRVYWYESRPFIYENDRGQMAGIEADIMAGFKMFLKKKHGIDLTIQYQQAEDFGDVYDRIRGKARSGAFGASAFSITPEREKEVNFSPPYMSDITVVISSKDVPVVKTEEEFNRVFSKLTAITVHSTTYEGDIMHLKSAGQLRFPIAYIPSNQNIVKTIEAKKNAFAFIDLPIYLMEFSRNPSIHVNRQNLFQVRRKGYAFTFPKNSDWAEPMYEYFQAPEFQTRLEKNMAKYINLDLYKLVETIAKESNDPVMLLTKEKEIQQKDLLGKTQEIAQETRWRNFLIVVVIVVFSFLLAIIILYRKRNEQKEQIEEQGNKLALKTAQLEERNQYLVELDLEKNNLIKILAHDLRTPISHVQGLATVFQLSNPNLPDDQKEIIKSISDSAIRLNKMITSILDIDAIENNRVHIYPEDLSISSLLRQVVNSFEKQTKKKEIELTFQTSGEDLLIRADSLFLIQILENLISNAIKFSPPQTKVQVSIQDQNGKVIICVKDQGPGLTTEDQQLLFKKFQRLSARPTGGEGSMGLGLSIVKKYVELMGGRVWGESLPGEGASFFVEFNKV